MPTPENLLERLVAALEAAGQDRDLDDPKRLKAMQAALWFSDALSTVAIAAFGGAAGRILHSCTMGLPQ